MMIVLYLIVIINSSKWVNCMDDHFTSTDPYICVCVCVCVYIYIYIYKTDTSRAFTSSYLQKVLLISCITYFLL